MRRAVGYLFFAGMGGAAVLVLVDRSRGGSMLAPSDAGGPDVLGIGLVVCALAGGVWLLAGRVRKGNGDDVI